MDLVFLHGPAAAGKLTTAQALERLVNFPVFHNHLVVDLLTTVFPFGSEPFVRLREEFWLSVLTEAARANRSTVFTFAPEATVTAGFAERARAAVQAAGGRVHFVRLLVSVAEQEHRLDAPSRQAFRKLTDVRLLRRLRQSAIDIDPPPVDLVIDTEISTPMQSAATIVAHFHLEPQTPLDPFPT